MQTTDSVPYDASSSDMKILVESLSQVCTVDASRVVKGHGFLWDLTFVSSKKDCHSVSPLVAVVANGENMEADVDASINIIGLRKVVIPVGSMPYYVRIAAINSFGVGYYQEASPNSVEASLQTPGAARDVFIEPLSNSKIRLQWEAPLQTGGTAVTHFKIEYHESSSFDSGIINTPVGSIIHSAYNKSAVVDIQHFSVQLDNIFSNLTKMYMAGTFSLSFNGQKTKQLDHNSSSKKIQDALNSLCTIQNVTVSRFIHCAENSWQNCLETTGYTWLVTFDSLLGNQHRRRLSKLDLLYSHNLAVDGSHLYECTDLELKICSKGGNAKATLGTVQETQEFTVGSLNFTITILGFVSDLISLTESIDEIDFKLNKISSNT